jgi:PAS domain S-box-containing protein
VHIEAINMKQLKKYSFLVTFSVIAFLYSLILVLLDWFFSFDQADEFIILFMIPAIYSANKYTERIYIWILFVTLICGMTVLTLTIDKPIESYKTFFIFFLPIVIVCEFIHRSTKIIKQTTNTLRENEERLRTIYDCAQDGFLIAETETHQFIDANQKMCDMLGYSIDEIVTLSVEDIHPAENLEYIVDRFNRQLQGEFLLAPELPVLRKDGTVFYADINSSPITLNGKPYLMGIFRDITEHKRANKKLRFQATLLDQIQDKITATDLEGNITYVNKAGSQPTETLSNDLIGEHVNVYGDDPNNGATQKDIIETTLQQGTWNGEVINIGKSGKRSVIHCRTNLLFDENNQPIGMLGIGTDITEKKKIENQLIQSEQLLNETQKIAHVGSYSHNLKTLKRTWSDENYRIFGYKPNEIIPDINFVKQHIHPEDLSRFENMHQDLFSGKRKYDLEYRIICKDGTIKYVRSKSIVEYDEQGEPIRQFGSLMDITNHKQIEEKLRESEEILRSTLEDLLVGVIVHAADSSILLSNPQAQRILGLSHDQMQGKMTTDPVWKFFREDQTEMKIEDYPVSQVIKTKRKIENQEFGIQKPDSTEITWVNFSAIPVFTEENNLDRIIVNLMDITDRKRAEDALERRIIALTRPLEDKTRVHFEDLFNPDEIQQLQDQFAEATGVASIITHPDGTPITKPSNFCYLCEGIIRKTEKGLANCIKSDAVIGHHNPDGPTVQPCLSGGLWDAGAAISVGGNHIANWLVGQVRDNTQTEEHMREYARDIGADEEQVVQAFHNVTAMSKEQFEKVSQALYTLANQLSSAAYQNIQQSRFIDERKQAEEALRKSESNYRELIQSANSIILRMDRQGVLTFINSYGLQLFGYSEDQLLGKKCNRYHCTRNR